MSDNKFLLPRPQKGERFIPAGDRQTDLTLLMVLLATTASVYVEFHFADGHVAPVAPEHLRAGLEAARARECDYRVILLSRENSPPPHCCVYGRIVADEEAARTITHYQRRYLPSPAFRACLLAGQAGFLHPDDYCHRLREINAARALARGGPAANSVEAFYQDAKSYNAGELSSDALPLTQEYSSSPAVKSHREDTIEWIHVEPPVLDEPSPAPPARDQAVPPAQPVPSTPPAPAGVGGQLGLDF